MTDAMEDEPTGRSDYVVRPGDGMSAIAEAHGFFWQTLWDLPANASLKAARDNPEVLIAGDRLTIPDPRIKSVSRAIDQRHVFRRRGVPVRVVFTVADAVDGPFANVRYTLAVGRNRYEGRTDGEGRLQQWVVPSAQHGELVVWPERPPFPETLRWRLKLGHLPPIGTVTGVQGRLNNLGFACGAQDGEIGPSVRAALVAFQRRYDLPESGEIDEATRVKLAEIYPY